MEEEEDVVHEKEKEKEEICQMSHLRREELTVHLGVMHAFHWHFLWPSFVTHLIAAKDSFFQEPPALIAHITKSAFVL